MTSQNNGEGNGKGGNGKGPSDRKIPPKGKPPAAAKAPERGNGKPLALKKTPGQREDQLGLRTDEADEEGRGKGKGKK